MIIQFPLDQSTYLTKQGDKKVRYIIVIDEQEEPAYTVKELQAGIMTVLVQARSPQEARQITDQFSFDPQQQLLR